MSAALGLSANLGLLDAESYTPHALHSPDRIWGETNCYVDVVIELLHSLGLEPNAINAYLLAADFEGDQWSFVKPPPEDLRRLYGLEIAELNVWRPVLDHLSEQLDLGRLITVEVDAFHLPDTRGVAYGLDHVKTTIVPAHLDLELGRLGYFHNAGYHRVDGADFAALLQVPEDPRRLPPYVEVIKFAGPQPDTDQLRGVARGLVDGYLARQPHDNPVRRLGERIAADLDWLVEADMETFHRYAFGTCRQSGATAELLADFVDWLYGTEDSAGASATAFRAAAEAARALQFNLARAVRHRRYDVTTPLAEMATAWETAMRLLRESHAR